MRPSRSADRAPRPAKGRLRPANLALAIVVLVLVGGCATLRAQMSTRAALSRDGFSGVNVSFQASTNPSSPDVVVRYTHGPTGQEAADAKSAAAVVWNTLPYRFRLLAIVRNSGGCLGPVCGGTSSSEVATYAQLRAQLGTRPARLDRTSVQAVLQHDGIIVLVALALVGLVGLAGIILVVTLVLRARRRGRQSPPPLPPGLPQWYSQGPQPPWGPQVAPPPSYGPPVAAAPPYGPPVAAPFGPTGRQDAYVPDSAATTGASSSAWPPGRTM
jgi:hypothetical protein